MLRCFDLSDQTDGAINITAQIVMRETVGSLKSAMNRTIHIILYII